MRFLLIIFVGLTGLSAQAQLTPLAFDQRPFGAFRTSSALVPFDHAGRHGWHLTPYAGLSTGLLFFNGGAVSALSVPVGLQLDRPINHNLTGFAAISAVPSVYTFGSPFGHSFLNGANGNGYAPGAYRFGMNERVEMGLMYSNDARTFSITGSIGVERGSYPLYAPARSTQPAQPKRDH